MKKEIATALEQISERLDPARRQQKYSQFASALGMQPMDYSKDDDVFVCGWPKSGNTWLQRIIASLVNGIDPQYLTDHTAQLLVPDVHYRSHYIRAGNSCYFKSHSLPEKRQKKVIHLVRDGRDALVSYWHMNNKIGNKIPLEEMVSSGKGCIPSIWSTHCRAWTENPYRAEILVIRYEDLLLDMQSKLKEICDFLNIERDIRLLTSIGQNTTFDAMRKVEDSEGWANPTWPKGEKFLRSGKSGTYKADLNGFPLELFEAEGRDMLSHFGYL